MGALASIYGREWLEKASKSVGGGLFATAVVAVVIFLIVVKVRGAKRAKKDAADIEAEIRLSSKVPTVAETVD